MNISRTFTYGDKTLRWTVTGLPAAPKVTHRAAPGAGPVAIAPVILAPVILATGGDVTLSTAVSGESIANILIEVLLYDEAAGYAYGPVYQDYLQAPDNEEIDGVIYPMWGEAATIHTTLRPTLRVLSDGEATAFAFAVPENYACPPEPVVHSIRGQFTTVEDTTSRTAKLYFDDAGHMTRITTYGERARGRSARRDIKPQPGDSFTPEGHVLLPPQDADGAWGRGMGASTPLTFKEETPFHMETLPLPPATYLAGILVEDFDGGFTRKYAPLIVLTQRDAIHETTAHSETRRHIPGTRRRPR